MGNREGGRIGAEGDGGSSFEECASQDALDTLAEVAVTLEPDVLGEMR